MARRRTRFRVPRSWRGGWMLAAVILLALVRFWYADEPTPEALTAGVHAVERIVDGDTLKLRNGAVIRLIGVDTPETVKPNWPVEPFGPEATEFTRQFVAEAEWRVELRFDAERKDRYGRHLAYVYHGDRFLNEELVRGGLARAQLQYRYASSVKNHYRLAEEEAKTARRGIWSAEDSPTSP